MRLSTESFRGEAPRVTPRALPDNAAQAAVNAYLQTGDLGPWRQFLLEHTLPGRDAPVRTIWKMTDNVWLSFEEEVDLARGIIPGDDTFRTYLTGLDAPRFTNLAMATSGAEPYPVDTRLLGVPGPDSAPTVAAGLDPTPTSFSIDVLDAGDKLATDWTVSSPLTGSTYGTVTQDAATGNPLPCYRTTFEENHDAGTEPWAFRDFGVAGVSVLSASVDFQVGESGHMQAMLVVGATSQGAGVAVVYNNGTVGIAKRTSWGFGFGGAGLASAACPGVTTGAWFSLRAEVTVGTNGAKTVTASVYNAASVKLGEVTATNTFDDGPVCGFANGTVDDGGPFSVIYDNIHVQATGSTNYTPVNTATSYVYTFVNDLGEESAPSFASATILRPDGVAITVTTPGDVPTGTDADYGITSKRIYRAASGSTGTAFLFVAEIPLAQTEYVDTVPDTELGDPLESTDWDLPPSDLRGILALPNGVMAGFSRNQLCLSAQNRPHAWPVRNRYTTDTDIVGIGSIDTTVLVGTENFPYAALGNDPSAYSMTKFEVPQACVSKRSIASLTGIGVVFASPDGLLAVSGAGQIRNLTENIFTREQWQELRPETIIGVAHDDVYHFFYDTEPE